MTVQIREIVRQLRDVIAQTQRREIQKLPTNRNHAYIYISFTAVPDHSRLPDFEIISIEIGRNSK